MFYIFIAENKDFKMEKRKKQILRSEEGFTLIEIIAALVILGILAAVATPKLMNLQDDSKKKVIAGALAAGISNAKLSFSKFILKHGLNPTSINDTPAWSDGTNNVDIETDLGDFTASYSYAEASDVGNVTVELSQENGECPEWFESWVDEADDEEDDISITFKIQEVES
jgi:prepilin-type N-terminal cleavage/methylation domain-containing protein